MSRTRVSLALAGALVLAVGAGGGVSWKIAHSARTASDSSPAAAVAQAMRAVKSEEAVPALGASATNGSSEAVGKRSATGQLGRATSEARGGMAPALGASGTPTARSPGGSVADSGTEMAHWLEVLEGKYDGFLREKEVPADKRKAIVAILANHLLDLIELTKIGKEQNLSRRERTRLILHQCEREMAELAAEVGDELAEQIVAFGAGDRGHQPLADSFAHRCSARGVPVGESLAAEIGRTLKATEASAGLLRYSRAARQEALNHAALMQTRGKLTAEQRSVLEEMLEERRAQLLPQASAPGG